MVDKARGIIEPGSTSVVIPGVPAGTTLTVTAYAEDVYGQTSDPTSDTVDTPASQVTLTDPDSGVQVLSTNTDPNIGNVGAHPFLASHWTRNIPNGDFHDAPPNPLSNIDNATNPLPGWNLLDTSSGGITAKWVADPTTGAGGYIQFTKGAHAVNTCYLEQYVLIRSGASRNSGAVLMASAKKVTSPPPDSQFIDVIAYEYDSDLNGIDLYSSASQSVTALSVIQDIYDAVGTPSFAQNATWLRILVGFNAATDTVNVHTAIVYDVGLVVGEPFLILPNISSPSGEILVLKNDGGSVSFNATLDLASGAAAALLLPGAPVPAQTAEGSVVWDTNDDLLTVGTGSGRKTMLDTTAAAAAYAPIGADYLVGTANATLTGEIAVGTTPGGELGGTWASPTVDATHSGSAHVLLTANTPQPVSTTGAVGSGTASAKDDHVHAHEAAHVAHDTLWDAKGDLVAGTGADTAAKVTVGADDTILMADSAQSTGLKWVASATPSTQAFGDAAATGTADTFTRGDHKHGMPAAPTAASVGASANPHGAADHTDVTRHFFLEAQEAKLDSGTASTLGTLPDQTATVALADAATQGAYWTFGVPNDYASGNLFMRPIWAPGSTDGSSHAVRWSADVRVMTNGTDVTSAGTTTAYTGVSQANTANNLMAVESDTDLGVSIATVNQTQVRLNLRRVGGNAADTYVGTVHLIGVRISYTAAE